MIQLRTEVPVSTPTPAATATATATATSTATAIPAPAPLAHATSAATTITSFLIFPERKTWPRRWMITISQFMNSNKTKIFSNSLCLVMHLCLKTLGSPHRPPRSDAPDYQILLGYSASSSFNSDGMAYFVH